MLNEKAACGVDFKRREVAKDAKEDKKSGKVLCILKQYNLC